MMPFARNESTKFISPTKTLEYLAGGKPVVSTSIRDVVQPYGELKLVKVADTVPDFVQAVQETLQQKADHSVWLSKVDRFLADISWDVTWERMAVLIQREIKAHKKPQPSLNPQIPMQGRWSPAE